MASVPTTSVAFEELFQAAAALARSQAALGEEMVGNLLHAVSTCGLAVNTEFIKLNARLEALERKREG